MPEPIIANAGESSGPDGGPVAHACIVEMAWSHLGEMLGIPGAGGLIIAVASDLNGSVKLLVQHPDAPPTREGERYPHAVLTESITLCEHGGSIERKVTLEMRGDWR